MEHIQRKSDGQDMSPNNSVNNEENQLPSCIERDNNSTNPLRQPEITVNLNLQSAVLLAEPIEEVEEDIFSDDESDISIEDGNSKSDEQVVPSISQLSTSYKYVDDDLTISDGEEDEGILEDYIYTSDSVLRNDNITHNSQPP